MDFDGPNRALLNGASIPSWVLSGAAIDIDFANALAFGGTLTSLLSISRASGGTDLLPTSASGASYRTFGNDTLRITPGLGLLVEEQRINVLLNSTAPVTQTSASLGTGSYTLWCNGAGTVTPSGNTATITGAAAASNGAPNSFVVTVAGTVDFTVSGALNAFQCELAGVNGTFGTSLIVTAGAQATRGADNITIIGALLAACQSAGVTQMAQTSLVQDLNGRPGINFNNLSMTLAFLNNSFTSAGIKPTGTSSTTTVGAGASYATGVIKTVGSFDAAGDSIVANGGAETTSVNTFPAITSGKLCSAAAGTTNQLDGYLSRLAIWSSRLPSATRIALSAP